MKNLSYRVFFGTTLVSVFLAVNIVQLLAGFGQSFPQSPTSLLITMPLIGIAVVIATWPIYRYRKAVEGYQSGPRPARPNPFYALRALVLARATALAGTVFLGWHIGALVWLVVFSVAPQGPVLVTSFGVFSALAMLIGGLVGQQNCRTPKSGGGEETA